MELESALHRKFIFIGAFLTFVYCFGGYDFYKTVVGL